MAHSTMRRLALVACALVSAPALATTMIPLDLAALTERAEEVVAGTVKKTEARWTSSHDAIYTDVTITVERSMTGNLAVSRDVVVRREGGSVDGIGMQVFGAPSFNKGDEVVVFLEHRGLQRYVVGMAQGKLDLFTTSDGVKTLHRELSGVAYVRPPTAAEQTLSSTAKNQLSRIDTLEELEVEVRRLAALRARNRK